MTSKCEPSRFRILSPDEQVTAQDPECCELVASLRPFFFRQRSLIAAAAPNIKFGNDAARNAAWPADTRLQFNGAVPWECGRYVGHGEVRRGTGELGKNFLPQPANMLRHCQVFRPECRL